MISSYYPIYEAERGKTAAEIRAADAQLGGLAARLGRRGLALAVSVRAVRADRADRRSPRRQRSAACPVAPDAG